MAQKYLIETFGCQMNVHDSERMAGLLEQAGYEATTDDAEADVIVINTCSVREHAEEKLYTRLGELRVLEETRGRSAAVVVAGCVAQQESGALLRKTNGHIIDVVLGTQQQKLLPLLVQRATQPRRPVVDTSALDDVSFPLGIARRSDTVRAYVSIIEGCNDHCSFCVVPRTRGRERMRGRAEILDEVRQAVASGHREVQLLGQIVNDYRAPDATAYDFSDLLAEANEIPGLARIRFASPHPRHTTDRLIDAMRSLQKVCKHIHLPAQSGSTRILAAMRRRHTREDYLSLLGQLRTSIPGITISTDMIVGFPGEGADDFEQTLSLTSAARFINMFSFKYSPRPNTLAAKRFSDDVPGGEKTARIVALQALQRKIQTDLLEEYVGQTVQVLVDSCSRRVAGEYSGRSDGNIVVNITSAAGNPPLAVGDLVVVMVRRAGPYSLWGVPYAETKESESPC